MKIQTKYTLLTWGLLAAVIVSIAAVVIRTQKEALENQARARLDAVLEGVGRIGQESVVQNDRLMLVSYLMFLQMEHPELAFAAVTHREHTAKIGKEHDGLFYLERAIAAGPTKYTVNAYPSAGGRADLTDNPGGFTLEVQGRADVKVERAPAGVFVRLGFVREKIEREVARALNPLIRKTLLIAAVFLTLSTLASMYLGVVLSQPIKALAAAAAMVSRGDMNVRVKEGSKDEIGMLTRNFNEMTGKLQDLLKFREDLLHTLTHELNTPLSGLKGYLELWSMRGLPENPADRADVLSTMTTAVARMEASLGGAVKLFKRDSDPEDIPRELVWINEVFDSVVKLFAQTAKDKGVTLEGPPPGVLAYLYGNEEYMRRVITNLVSNAVKYTKKGGTVRCRLDATPGRVSFSVSDNGPGIAPEDLPNIFTKFFRTEDSRRGPVPGTGLGLAIAKNAVEAMGGQISVESRIGVGTKFIVTFEKFRGTR